MTFDPISYINEPRWLESRLGLERITELLERLGNPQEDLSFVHVAGTNGKGSTCAFLASIVQAAGYRTGLFTSPYIIEFSDRIKIDGVNITEEELRSVTLKVKEAADAMADHPTEFELMTAVAFLHFAQQKCDLVVCEVGLGGRLDSTNVIAKPEVSVISAIGLDHTTILGNTVAKIAAEKAGIIKKGVPVVSWPQEHSAQEVIEQVAQEQGTQVIRPDFSSLVIHPDNPLSDVQARFTRHFDYQDHRDLSISLLGNYQPNNAAVALETIEVLREQGWKIDDNAIRTGLAQTRWPGRFELVAEDPWVVIDGAHNLAAVRSLLETLEEVFPGKKLVFIIGLLEDKDYPEMLEIVVPRGSAFITIEPPNPRALSADRLAQAIRWTGQDLMGCSACVNPYSAQSIPDAVAHARKIVEDDGVICAFGSLYSIAALKVALKNPGV